MHSINMQTKMFCCTRLYCLLVICNIASSVSNVHWTVTTKPMVIGEDLDLFCNTSVENHNCPSCPMIWSAGSDNRVINFNNYSYEPEKFEVFSKEGGLLLKIKKFSKRDCLYSYTCSYGFEKYTDNLLSITTDDNPIISLPERNETIVYYNNSGTAVKAKVFLDEVSPQPICKVMINGEDASENLTRQIKESKPLYSATFELEYSVKKTACKDNLQVEMTCLLSDKEIVMFNETLQLDCTEYNWEATNTQRSYNYEPVFAVAAFILVILAFAFLLLRRKQSMQSVLDKCVDEWCFVDTFIKRYPKDKNKDTDHDIKENNIAELKNHILSDDNTSVDKTKLDRCEETETNTESDSEDSSKQEFLKSSKEQKFKRNNHQQTKTTKWIKRFDNFFSKTDKERERKSKKTIRSDNGYAKNREKDIRERFEICDETGTLGIHVQVVCPLTDPARPQVADRGKSNLTADNCGKTKKKQLFIE